MATTRAAAAATRRIAGVDDPLNGNSVSSSEQALCRRSSPSAPLRESIFLSFRGGGPGGSIVETQRMGPQTHRLPFRIMWSINLLTAVCMALLNFVMVLSIEKLCHLKFWLMQAGFSRGCTGLGILALAAVSVSYALIMVCLIQFISPNCGGSGIPENKTYLNGGSMPGFYSTRTLGVRVATNVLANAAGFPVGREGPMVTIGSNIAFKISKRLAKRFVKEWINFSRLGGARALLLDEQRLGHATRISCTVGGACAMTVIFNAPFGGLLYMFEEVTAISWPLELTFRVFVSTMCSSLLSLWVCSMMGSDIDEFVIYARGPQTKKWSWADLPVFVLVAVCMGVFTTFHTRGMLAMAQYRQSLTKILERWQPWAKIIETGLYGAVCALASALVSLLGSCTKEGESGLQYVVFNCGKGEYNPIASLLVATSHSSVKLLFSGGNAGEINSSSCFLAFLTYSTLNICLAGLPVPGGAFTATMLMGAMFGRFVGEVIHDLGFPSALSGVYAVVGSAAMLCGFKQMTLASVLIVIECVNDLSLAPIVMLGVVISMAINREMNKRGHDEEVIIRRKLPFLEAEVPHHLEAKKALDLCDDLPPEAILEQKASPAAVQRALKGTEMQHFPIQDGDSGPCIGIITRPHLEAALKASFIADVSNTTPSDLDDSSIFPDTEMCAFALKNSGGSNGIPLFELMDPTPMTIVDATPAPRLWAMFSKAGEHAACVTTRSGEMLGIITREGLISKGRPDS